MYCADEYALMPSFHVWIPFISFSFIIVSMTSVTTLNRSRERQHPCLVPELGLRSADFSCVADLSSLSFFQFQFLWTQWLKSYGLLEESGCSSFLLFLVILGCDLDIRCLDVFSSFSWGFSHQVPYSWGLISQDHAVITGTTLPCRRHMLKV